MNNRGESSDVLIVGSGLAGLACALYLAESDPHVKITILCKGKITDSNTSMAQGGIACVTNPKDRFELHIRDTLSAGDGRCDEQVVRQVISSSPCAIADLERWGVRFDLDLTGNKHLALEGGHSKHRIVHCKDVTGMSVIKSLTEKIEHHRNIHFVESMLAIDLIMSHEHGVSICCGVDALDTVNNGVVSYFSKAVVLATGGIGQLFQATTNAEIATGDGIAMALRAGLSTSGMHFIQFHPTGVYAGSREKVVLITEAIRGAGAILRNHRGEAFMAKYHPKQDLAPRDVVSRAMHTEMAETKAHHLYLDLRQVGADQLKRHFLAFIDLCSDQGWNPDADLIPVFPVAHYLCGGIDVNKDGLTELFNLYACGECSNTGLHGANRLASNSLLEALVYAKKVAVHLVAILPVLQMHKHRLNAMGWTCLNKAGPQQLADVANMRMKVQKTIQECAGPVRNYADLRLAKIKLEQAWVDAELLLKQFGIGKELVELLNLVQIGIRVLEDAVNENSNAGVHYNLDLEIEQAN